MPGHTGQCPGMSSGSFGQKNAQSSLVKQSPSLNAKGKEEIGKKSIWSHEEEEERKKKEEDEKQELEFAEGFRRIENYSCVVTYM